MPEGQRAMLPKGLKLDSKRLALAYSNLPLRDLTKNKKRSILNKNLCINAFAVAFFLHVQLKTTLIYKQ